jgi:DNA-binding Lrp family transcriptional regulator
MDFLIDQLKVLGLNNREVKVFTALSTFDRANMSKLAARAGLPRTTVDAIVRRLIDQGIISREKVAGHFEYAVQHAELADRLDWIEQRLRPQPPSTNGHPKQERDADPAPLTNDENIVIDGTADEKAIVEREFVQHAGERVRLLFSHHPTGSVDGVDALVRYIGCSITAGTKLEVLLCARTADMLRSGAGVPLPKNPGDVRLNMVPASYCQTTPSVLIFRDTVLFIKQEKDHPLRVAEPTVVASMQHLLDIACETGWSVNLIAWLS